MNLLQNLIKLRGDLTESNFKFSFGLSHRFMQILGIWPLDDYSYRTFRYYFCLSTFIFTMYATGTAIFTASTRAEAIKRVMFLVIAVATTLKIIILRCNRPQLKILLEEMAINWNGYLSASLETQMIMNSFMNRGRSVNVVLSWFSQISYIVFITSITINFYEDEISVDDKIVNSIYPKDLIDHPNLIYVYVVEIVCSQVSALSVITMDSFFMIIVLHVSSQLSIICKQIENSDSENLKYNISEHIRKLRLIEYVEEAFNVVLIIDFIKYVIHFGILIHLIVMFFITKNTFRLIECVIYIFSINFFILLPFIFIQQLIDTVEKVGMAVYFTNWTAPDSNNFHEILLMILRSQNKKSISAAKFFKLTMETYKNVLAMAASYASVLFATR